ncbi:hypothetical protein QFC22_002975 [Naganishia vaughanmartiniae]|uniref:Uncharacterized protein n=1 Tax=Naganishia vaughanmartiniae TaxID=1424756 RepID=A0ACC2XBD7_9TREE|nr:hypothetical protein QFC22_002975 [Naganishia vaughanmartiniae]
MFRSNVVRRAVASTSVSAPSSTTSKSTLFTHSKHLRSSASTYGSTSSTVASLSTTTSLSSPSSEEHAYNEPIPPQLPPRRRPQFAAAGFGLGGSHNNHPPLRSSSHSDNASSTMKNGTRNGNGLTVPVAAVLQPGETIEDRVDGLQEEFNAAAERQGSSNDAEACYVVRL